MDNELQKLKKEVEQLRQQMNRENFSNLQVFSKDVQFEKKIKVFNKSANLAKCETGELSVVGGKLYICSAADTWTIVGTQT
jgi:hypothetical protein